MTSLVDAVPPAHAAVLVQRRVEWPDTDAAGHYHHSTVVRWVEAAEAVLSGDSACWTFSGACPACTSRPSTPRGCGSATSSTSLSAWPGSGGRR